MQGGFQHGWVLDVYAVLPRLLLCVVLFYHLHPQSVLEPENAAAQLFDAPGLVAVVR